MDLECSIVMPAFNEAVGLRDVVAELQTAQTAASDSYELIIIDDGSSDATWSVVTELAAADVRVRGLRFSRNFGKEAAIRAGLEAARGRAVVVIDADLQHPVNLISDMLARWRLGDVDIVEAIKFDRGKESLLQRAPAQGFYRLFRALAGYELEGAADFKLLDRTVVQHYLALPEANLFFRGLTAWMGFRTARIPFAVAPRRHGSSSWSFTNLVGLALRAVTSFSSAPLHLVTLLGLGFLGFALALGVQTLWRYFTGSAVAGFTTVILVVLIAGSGIMIGLGIIGEYLARIYDEVKQRPRYFVMDRCGVQPVSSEPLHKPS